MTATAAQTAASAATAVKSGLSPLQQELLNRADSIFAAVADAVGKAKDFAAEQLPDIAYQYVAYGRAINTVYELLGLTLFLLGLYLFVRVAIFNSYKIRDDYGSWGAGRVISTFAGLISVVVGFIIMMANLSQFAMVWFAPKVWLIQEIVHLIKR